MATSGFHSTDNKVKRSMKWPLEYARETREYMCGWCGHLLTAIPSHDDLNMHFQSCKTTLLKDQIKTEVLDDTEVGKEMEIDKTEVHKKILDVKKDLEGKSGETSDAILFNKVNILEEKMREMGVDHERKMAEINGRVSGVTEAISTVVQSMIEDRLKKETEALWLQLRKSEEDIQTVKTQIENEVAHLKTEAFSEWTKTIDRDFQVLERQMVDEASKQSLQIKSFQQEPSSSDQFTVIPMNCFNLVTRNYLFQPSFKWTVDGIKAITARKTFELTSEKFQSTRYPVQARAKLQLKEDSYVYVSLALKRNAALESESTDDVPIPQFTYSLEFNACLCAKSWFKHPDYNVGNSVKIEIYVEPTLMHQLVRSYDGTLDWNIENYKKRLQLEKDCLVPYEESPYFYTGPSGYRVQVRICLKGVNGSEPTACILFRTGKNDAQLLNSFPHSTTVTFIHRNPERSINKTVTEDITSGKYYSFEICKFKEMKNVVENDTLFCKVVIKAH